MPTLLDAPAPDKTNPFADFMVPLAPASTAAANELIGGGTPDAPAFQTVNGQTSNVPIGVAVSTTDYGPFSDLASSGPDAKPIDDYAGQFGMFSDLVPPSPTPETDAAVADTPDPMAAQSAADLAAAKAGSGSLWDTIKQSFGSFIPALKSLDAASDAPLIPSTSMQTILHFLSGGNQTVGMPSVVGMKTGQLAPASDAMSNDTAAGVTKGAADFASGLTSAKNVAMLVSLWGAPQIVERAVALGFSAQGAKAIYDESRQLSTLTDPAQRARAMTSIVLNGAMVTAAGIAGVKGSGIGETPPSPAEASGPEAATTTPPAADAVTGLPVATADTALPAAPDLSEPSPVGEVAQSPDTTAGAPAPVAGPESVPSPLPVESGPAVAPPADVGAPLSAPAPEISPAEAPLGDATAPLSDGQDNPFADLMPEPPAASVNIAGVDFGGGTTAEALESARQSLAPDMSPAQFVDTGLATEPDFAKGLDPAELEAYAGRSNANAATDAEPQFLDTEAAGGASEVSGAGKQGGETAGAEPAATLPAAAPAPARGSGSPDAFGTELTPVATSIINDIGGLMSKSTAKAKGLLEQNGDLWDGAPTLQNPTHNKIYRANGGEMPDVAAQALYDAGLIRDPSVDTMWQAIAKESQTAKDVAAQERARTADEKAPSAQPPPPAAEPIARPPGDSPISITHAAIDDDRAARGLEPVVKPLRQSDPVTWDKASAILTDDPRAGADLVDAVNGGKKTTTSAVERAVMFQEKIRLANESQMEAQRANDPGATDAERSAADDRFSDLEARATKTDEAIHATASAAGSSLRAQQLMAFDDYTLAKMQSRRRLAKGGPLTSADNVELDAARVKIAALEKQWNDAESARADAESTGNAQHVLDQVVADLKLDAKKASRNGGTLRDSLSVQAEKAKARIIARRGRLNAGIDPTALVDEAIIGASHIANGLGDFADWSKQMLKDFGERLRPYLDELFQKSKALHDATAQLYQKAGEKTRDSILADAAAHATAGEALDHQTVFDLARAHVKAGVEGLDNVMQAVHGDLEPLHPGITEREVRDTFTEYGKTKFPSRADDLTKLREYRRLGQLQSAIEDAMAKEAPKKTGLQRDKPSQAVREKTAELRDAMRANGIETSSPEEQLASQNQARQTALKNQIADLEKEIATGEKRKPSPTTPDSPEVTALKSTRDDLKAKAKAISDADPAAQAAIQAARLSRYKNLLDRKTAEVRARVADDNYIKPPKPVPLKLDREAAQKKILFEDAKRDEAIKNERLRQASVPLYKKALKAVLDFPRAVRVWGHGTVGMITHAGEAVFQPTKWGKYWPNFISQFKFLASRTVHQMAMDSLVRRPDFDFWKSAGLANDPRVIYTDYAKYAKYFGPRWSKAGFDALKVYRQDLADAFWKKVSPAIKADPEAAMDMARNHANAINHSTGTLHKDDIYLGKVKQAAGPLSFAAGLETSRWARIIGDPAQTVATFLDKRSTPGARSVAKARIGHAAEFIGTYFATLLANQALLSATGQNDKINFTDPTKRDWLVHKFAGHTMAAEGGVLAPVRLLALLVMKDFLGPKSALNGDTRTATALLDASYYFMGKATPAITVAKELATGETFGRQLTPNSIDKPSAKHPQLTWPQYIAQQGPIPLEGSVRVYNQLRAQGMSDDQSRALVGALITFGIENTGARVAPEQPAFTPTPHNTIRHATRMRRF